MGVSGKSVALPDRITQADLAAVSDNPNKESSKPYLAELLKLRDKEGRDNALIHYVVAGWALPVKVTLDDQAMKTTLEQGWNPQSAKLLPILESCQIALGEVRKGAALDYAKGIGFDQEKYKLMPDFQGIFFPLARLLCVEGRYFENQGQYSKALDNYLTALTLGRDCGGADQTLIGNLISIAAQNATLKPMGDLVTGGHLARPDLEKAATRLKQIQKTTVSLRGVIEGEAACESANFRAVAVKLKQGLEIAQKVGKNPDDVLKETLKEVYGTAGQNMIQSIPLPILQGMGKDLDKVTAKYDEMVKFNMELADTPFWKRDFNRENQDIQRLFASLHLIAQTGQSNYMDPGVRHTIRQTKVFGAQLQIALELSRLDKRRYPGQLSELVPTYFEAVPLDPFCGAPFAYFVTADGKGYNFFSVGPDKKTGPVNVIYDVKSGLFSQGDIPFGKQ
ncbi:TPA: hypothetical protein DDW35_09495 [Candidatus Sumerlaeota bacterium]|nr:hypothetical protein [Candidatus Sumerlaeota bacterium]